jgi:hypothetical protein
VLNEPGLANPWFSGDQEQSSPAADRIFEAGYEFCHFPVPAHECARSQTRGSAAQCSHPASQRIATTLAQILSFTPDS